MVSSLTTSARAPRAHPRACIAVERGVLGLAAIVELLAQPRADLLGDLAGVDLRAEPALHGEDHAELAEIGFDRRLHVGILELAGERPAVEADRAMHLAERGGGRRLVLERTEALLPVGPELGQHAALDEGPAHRRRLALQLLQLGGVFRRQHVGNGREQLGDLHQRPLQAAERRGKIGGVPARSRSRRGTRAGHPRRHAADVGADAGVAAGAGGEAVFSRGRSWRYRDRAHLWVAAIAIATRELSSPKRARKKPIKRRSSALFNTSTLEAFASPKQVRPNIHDERPTAVAFVALFCGNSLLHAQEATMKSTSTGVFTEEQAKGYASAYNANCADVSRVGASERRSRDPEV